MPVDVPTMAITIASIASAVFTFLLDRQRDIIKEISELQEDVDLFVDELRFIVMYGNAGEIARLVYGFPRIIAAIPSLIRRNRIITGLAWSTLGLTIYSIIIVIISVDIVLQQNIASFLKLPTPQINETLLSSNLGFLLAILLGMLISVYVERRG